MCPKQPSATCRNRRYPSTVRSTAASSRAQPGFEIVGRYFHTHQIDANQKQPGSEAQHQPRRSSRQQQPGVEPAAHHHAQHKQPGRGQQVCHPQTARTRLSTAPAMGAPGLEWDSRKAERAGRAAPKRRAKPTLNLTEPARHFPGIRQQKAPSRANRAFFQVLYATGDYQRRPCPRP